MTVRIKSKRVNFRRCGMPHPKGPVDYPDDRFADDELEILVKEPMLTVEFIEDDADAEAEILIAARKAIEDGNTTREGKPDVKSMEAILGRNISAKDRDAAWDQIRAEGGAE